MKLRQYEAKDAQTLAQLFYDTVHRVNAKDYTKQQCDAWASGRMDMAAWHRSFAESDTVVAERRGLTRFTLDASVTARRFFERRGYCVISENTVLRHGVALTNFSMEKL